MNEPELSRKVSEEEFNAFVAAYPRPLAEDTSGIPVPPVTSYCDFGSGLKWPEAVVASVCRGDLMEPAEPRIFRIWDTPEAVARCEKALERTGQLRQPLDKTEVVNMAGGATRTMHVSVAVIDPYAAGGVNRTDMGYRYVYASVDVFPDRLRTSWRSAITQDIQSATADALRHLAEKLAELPWKE
jgi:hypothetical protein